MTRYTLHDKRHEVSLNSPLLTVACFAHLCRFLKMIIYYLLSLLLILRRRSLLWRGTVTVVLYLFGYSWLKIENNIMNQELMSRSLQLPY